MFPIVSWTVTPTRGNVNVVNGGIEAFFRDNGFDRGDGLRLQACVEGVFSYCVKNIREHGQAEKVRVDLFWKKRELRVVVRHSGPGGEWDFSLRPECKDPIRRIDFDAMGLFIAREIADKLSFDSQYDIAAGRGYKEYEIVYGLDRERGGGRGKDAGPDAA